MALSSLFLGILKCDCICRLPNLYFLLLSLQEVLEQAIELCKFPPIPDAICRLEKCLVPLKAEIYLTDPDFKVSVRRKTRKENNYQQ